MLLDIFNAAGYDGIIPYSIARVAGLEVEFWLKVEGGGWKVEGE